MALLLACERKNVGKGELPFEPVDVEGRRRVVLPPEHLVIPHPAVDERRGERFVTEAGLVDRLPAELAVAQTVPCGAEVVLRSEEHTSELQSPDHLVCRLLLEKKKKAHHHTCRNNTMTANPKIG